MGLMDSLQVAGGILLGHGSFSGSFPVTALVTHYYHLSRYGFYMKHNVFNQNQVNAGVSSLEPRVTLAAKSSDSVPFLSSAQLRGSHLRHFTNGPSSIHHLLSASSLSCGGNVPLLCALPRLPPRECLPRPSPSLSPAGSLSQPSLTTSLLSFALRTKTTVHSI